MAPDAHPMHPYAIRIIPMKTKLPAAKPPSRTQSPPVPRPTPNPAKQADSRWQRTVRYGWDKGGAKGGR